MSEFIPPDQTIGARDKTSREMTVELANELVKRTDKAKEGMLKLEKDYKAAAEYLDYATDHVKTAWLNWLEESSKYLNELRLWRMSMETEAKKGTQQIKDVLDFMGDDSVKTKLSNLKELIELSDRLKALKDSGFLDSVVETLLKVKP